MRISVLIVNWNTREDLKECLESLARQPASLEVIVVDNASADGSADMVRREHPGVTLLAQRENLGYAAGNNLAAEAASGDALMFLNPDTVAPPAAPDALAAFLGKHPGAALVAPQLRGRDGRIQASVRGMPTPAALLGAWLYLDRLFPRHPVWGGYRLPAFDYGVTQRAPQPMASAWMVRREAWEDVGPFDTAFPLFFNDVDWCLRAESRGWEVWYDAETRIIHRGGAGTSQIKPKATWESHRALVAFYRKHYAKRLGPLALAAASTAIMALGALRAGWHALQRLKTEN